jgi:DNA-binding PadR family transcriptional regulator
MNKPLYILILERLYENNAFVDSIQIKTHFLEYFNSYESKQVLYNTLSDLRDKGLVDLSMEHSIFDDFEDIVTAVNLTPKGEQYLRMQNADKPTYHIENSQNVALGSGNTQSSLEASHSIINAPINSPTKNASKSHKNKSRRSFIIAVCAGIVVVLFVVLLKSCGVNAQIIMNK